MFDFRRPATIDLLDLRRGILCRLCSDALLQRLQQRQDRPRRRCHLRRLTGQLGFDQGLQLLSRLVGEGRPVHLAAGGLDQHPGQAQHFRRLLGHRPDRLRADPHLLGIVLVILVQSGPTH